MICLLCGKSTNFNEQEDEQAEYDSIGTIESIGKALKKAGCETFFIEAGTELSEKLKKCNPDIVFNIAEGKGGRGREAQVPSMLNYYGIPFTGSDETTLCIALDKGLTKRIVKSCRINQCFFWEGEETKIPSNLHFPAILKPNAEGSSKGVLGNMIAKKRKELHMILKEKWDRYHQSNLVEEYITGREFTVGILGNGDEKRIFRPMEIVISPDGNPDGSKVYSFHVKKNYQKYVQYKCPALLDFDIEQKMIQYSKKIFEMLECKDFARF